MRMIMMGLRSLELWPAFMHCAQGVVVGFGKLA